MGKSTLVSLSKPLTSWIEANGVVSTDRSIVGLQKCIESRTIESTGAREIGRYYKELRSNRFERYRVHMVEYIMCG